MGRLGPIAAQNTKGSPAFERLGSKTTTSHFVRPKRRFVARFVAREGFRNTFDYKSINFISLSSLLLWHLGLLQFLLLNVRLHMSRQVTCILRVADACMSKEHLLSGLPGVVFVVLLMSWALLFLHLIPELT